MESNGVCFKFALSFTIWHRAKFGRGNSAICAPLGFDDLATKVYSGLLRRDIYLRRRRPFFSSPESVYIMNMPCAVIQREEGKRARRVFDHFHVLHISVSVLMDQGVLVDSSPNQFHLPEDAR